MLDIAISGHSPDKVARSAISGHKALFLCLLLILAETRPKRQPQINNTFPSLFLRFAQLSGVSGQLQTYRTNNKQKSNDTNAKHYNNKTATGRQQTRQQNPGARTDTSPLCEATSKTIITGCNKPERQPRETTTTQQ